MLVTVILLAAIFILVLMSMIILKYSLDAIDRNVYDYCGNSMTERKDNENLSKRNKSNKTV